GPVRRFSNVDDAPLLRCDRADAWRPDTQCAQPDDVTAGMEHGSARVARMDAPMTVSRRDVLKLAVLAAAHPLLPVRGVVSQVFAAPGAADAKFLLVFLRGGYDAANVVIPIGSDFYYESRPTIAVPKPDPSNLQAAISLAKAGDAAIWGLHPSLKDT